jgi:tetratricopeptide (TPR) repeat protein
VGSSSVTGRAVAVPRRIQVLRALAALLLVACLAPAVYSALLWGRVQAVDERLRGVRGVLAAREQLEAAVAAEPANARARVALGVDLTQRGQVAAAAIQLTTAHALAPDDPLTSYGLGRFHLETGNTQQALAPLERAALLDPGGAEIRLHLGLAYLNQDNIHAARKEFEEVLRLDPRQAEAHLGLAMTYTDLATADRAMAEIENYIRLAENSSIGRVLLSRTYVKLQDIPRAIEAGRLAVREQPQSLLAWQTLALALSEGSTEERAEAEGCFRRAIEITPAFADAHIGLGRAYLQQRKYAEAAAAFELALSLDASAGYIRYELGQAYQGAGREEEGREQFRAAEAYMDYKREVVAAQRAIVENPGSAEHYLRLGRIYASRGVYDWARPSIERALELKPGDPELQRELRRMQEMSRD